MTPEWPNVRIFDFFLSFFRVGRRLTERRDGFLCHYACGHPIKGPTGSQDGKEGDEEVGQSGPSHSEWAYKERERGGGTCIIDNLYVASSTFPLQRRARLPHVVHADSTRILSSAFISCLTSV